MSAAAKDRERFEELRAEHVVEDTRAAIGAVAAENVMKVWDRVEPILRRVVTPETGHTLDSVLNELQYGYAQLWVIDDFKAVAVTKVITRPLNKALWTQFMAGEDMSSWLGDWEEVLGDYARLNGCEFIEFMGRNGWHKKMAKHPGFKATHTIFRKNVKV